MQHPAKKQAEAVDPLTTRHQPLITGLILAGGQGTRLGGVDKGLQPWRGQPLIRQVLARLAPQVDSICINCNRHHADHAAFGYPVVTDRIGGFSGPLAGLQAGLHVCTTPYLLTVPCDAPFLPPDLARRLLAALNAATALAVSSGHPPPRLAIASQTQGKDVHWQPVFALYHQSVLPHLEAFLQQGQHQVRRWQNSLPHCLADFSDQPEAFTNLNTAAEWAASETGQHLQD